MTEDPTPPSLPAVGAWVGQLWDLDAPAARAAARRLEDAGYGVLWISEAFGREVLSFAAVLLAATARSPRPSPGGSCSASGSATPPSSTGAATTTAARWRPPAGT